MKPGYAALAGVLALAGACKGKEGPQSVATTPPASATSPAPSPQAVQNAGQDQVDKAFADVPGDRAWVRAPDANVTGAAALSCQAKIAGDWMRVYCHGKDAKGGTPTAVAIVAKSDDVTKAAFYESKGEGMALLFPHQASTHLEAVFSWTDGARRFTADWPATGSAQAFKGAFTALSGTITPISVAIQADLDTPPGVPVHASVEDLIANGKAYKGKLVSVLGWQNGTVDGYMGIGDALYPDEDSSTNDIFYKTSELSPEERKMIIRGACHVVVVGVWDGSIINTFAVRKTTGEENGARVQQMIDDEAARLRQKGF